MRIPLALLAIITLAGCRTYPQVRELQDQDGLMDANTYAAYGPEQAQKIAVGRKLAETYAGDTWEARAAQIEATLAYARSLPDVVDAKADTAGYFVVLSFKSGWRVAASPVKDGVAADATPGLPGR